MSLEKSLAEAWGSEAWGPDHEAEWAEFRSRFPILQSKLVRTRLFGRTKLDASERDELVRRGRGLSFTDKHRLYMTHIWDIYTGSLWPDEQVLSDGLIDGLRKLNCGWYHGGSAGRQVGDKLLPPSVTGIKPRGEARAADRPYWVWMTSRAALAARYASPEATPDGQLYRIEPEGKVIVDPRYLRQFMLWLDDPELNVDFGLLALMIPEFCCESATVLEVIGHERASCSGRG